MKVLIQRIAELFHVVTDLERISDHAMNLLWLAKERQEKNAKISEKAAEDSIPTGAAPVAPGEAQLESGFPFTAVAVSDGEGNSPRVFKGEGLGWSSDVIGVGTTVTVVGGGNDIHWFKVQVNGSTGYMPSKFIIR